MSILDLHGIYFQQVKKFETPLVELIDGVHIKIQNGGNIAISVHGLKAIMYTLDRTFVSSWHTAVTISQPWRRPNNVVFIIELIGNNQVKMTTISAVEQSAKFWLVCEEKIINIFTDNQGFWSPQLWGKTAEVEMLAKLDIEALTMDRHNHKHPKLQIGEVAFYNVASGTGAVCIMHDGEQAILARVFWRDIVARKSLGDMQALVAGEVIEFGKAVPLTDPQTSFKWEVKDLILA